MSKRIKVNVGTPDEMGQRFVSAWHRLELLRAVHENPAPSVKSLAERLGRDYKRVHEDVEALTASGLLRREAGCVSAPYDAITAEMRL
jgi:predicted transcriptional regulator